MANEEYSVKKYYQLGSLDLGSTLVARDPNISPEQSNITATESGSITVRPGREIVVSSPLLNGPEQGLLKRGDDIFYADDNAIFKLQKSEMLLSFSPSSYSSAVAITKEIVSGNWRFRIASQLSSSYIYDINLGTGLESNPFTNYSLHQALQAAPGGITYQPVLSSDVFVKSLPAATYFPKVPPPGVVTNTVNTIPGFTPKSISWEAGRSNMNMLYSARNKRWPMLPHAQYGYEGDLFIGVGERLLKYDGYNLTSAGLRQPENLSLSLVSGSVLNGTYAYAISFARKDPTTLVEVESEPYYVSSITTSGAQHIQLTIPARTNWRPSWETSITPWGGLAQGAQSVASTGGEATLTLDDGFGNVPYLDVGDSPWFMDNALGLISRRIIAINGKSVSFSTTTSLNVSDNAVFSPITIKVYRSKVGPSSLLYLQSIKPVDVSAANQAIVDSIADTALGEEFTLPLTERLPFPDKGGVIDFLGVYRGLLIVGTNGVVVYSDITSPEYFPGEFAFQPTPEDPTDLTGASFRQDHFLIFKENSTAIVSGDLLSGQYTVDTLSHEIGCCSPFSIQEISDIVARGDETTIAEITYWVSRSGVFRQSGSGSPQCISRLPGASIHYLFTPNQQDSFANFGARGSQIVWESVNSYHDTDLKVYVIYLPLNKTGAQEEVIDSYRVFAFDYVRNQWREWTDCDFSRGVVQTSERDIFFGARRRFNEVIHNLVEKKLRFGSKYDISDGVNAVDWSYKTGFETLGEPSTDKKVTRARVENFDVNKREAFSVRLRQNTLLRQAATDAVVSFVSGTYSQTAKIKKTTANAHQFELSGSSLDEQPVISGLEVEYSTPVGPMVGKDK